jgi:hypothetical protein
MMNLFEIMQAAQGGRAVDNLSRTFGLSPQQTQTALEALLPAFSMGLQHKAQSPDHLSQLAGMMGAPTNRDAYEQGFVDANRNGIPDHLEQQGNQVLGTLFGSKDMSRAVAAQASAASGVSDQILKSMLPVVASMIMGGLFKSAQTQGLGGLLGQLASGMLGGGQPQQGGGNPLGDLLGGMMGGQRGQPGMGAGGMGAGGMGGGLGGLIGAVLGGMGGGAQPAPQPGAPPAQAGLEALTRMFDTGRQVQDSYQSNLQSVFDAFLGPQGGQRR